MKAARLAQAVVAGCAPLRATAAFHAEYLDNVLDSVAAA
jgi:hypothetical protein